ncbi:TraR/DksA family transcriptional regulator [Tropicibacter naphthalenivorans]|uniref:General stress protein 16O n=1 Tax=Tropicibacter naphthalenivorans TaxID=441103 RepID=A0A0P1GKH1_9RHOB|nr:TraR/DksA C4-type zinc finger protein [Tropicibacter naphthalenivorans]CUH82652.1 General stress protein 16O [Tropicibacter naphthalenivorans]SMD10166.1 transcriptional regulator, TraR/DksA family [Tropicibacter naphthalenivorans]
MSHHQYKLRLLNRLRELGGRLDDIENALEEPHSKDWEEMAVEREGEEVLERLGESGQAEVARIRSALSRMASGEYGFCVKCGDEIASARLDAVPEAPLCASCAAKS